MTHFVRSLFHIATFTTIAFSALGQSSRIKNEAPKPWVKTIHFDPQAAPPAGQESSSYYLLIDEQENVALEESFARYVYKILTNEGLQQMADLSFEFDPAYEKIIFHKITVHRNGKVINQLPREMRTIQREESMDRFLYDGTLTAVHNLTDVRVGDIIEYSYTRKGYNPIYGRHFSRRISISYGSGYEKYFQRLLTPSSATLLFKNVNTEVKPNITEEGNLTAYTWEANRKKSVLTDNNEPDWHNPFEMVLVSNFKNWEEVAQWAVARYQLSEEEKRVIANEIVPQFTKGPSEEYILEVIRFVQDEIRYLGFESGMNSHKPHSPAQVYNQRFGDCKDKSLLLSSLLNAKGIESSPVLVNTIYRDKISEQLPSVNSFNHCVVQIKLDDKYIYIDPTISSQGGALRDLYFPNYGKGLVVSTDTGDLTKFPGSTRSSVSEIQTFDLATVGGEGMLKIKTTYKGSDADGQRSHFLNNNLETVQKNYLSYYGNLYPDIQKFEDLKVEDNRDSNTFIVSESYKIPTFWKPYQEQEGKIFCEFYPQTLEGYFNVSKSALRTAPYRLQYPCDYTHEIRVKLPEEWTIPPDELKIETDYYKYDYKVNYEDKYLRLHTKYSTRQEAVPVEKFTDFVEDHGKMMGKLSYSLIYNKLAEKESNTLPGALVTILALALGVALTWWLYLHYNPAAQYAADVARPIGGWLVLIGLGITFTPIRLIYDFVTNDYLLSGEAWLSMWRLDKYAVSIFLVVEHLYNVTYLVFSVLLVILFFQRKSSVPRLASIWLAVSCVFVLADNVVSYQIDSNTALDYKQIFQSIISAAIWIPYFHLSERSKQTFLFLKNDSNANKMPPALP